MSDREDHKKPMSSEDLVKRARDELFGTEATRERENDGPPPPQSSEGASAETDPVDEYAEFLRSTRTTTPSSIAEPETVTPPATDEPPSAASPTPTPRALSDEELAASWNTEPEGAGGRSWDPDWTPAASSGYGSDRPVGGPDPSVLPTPPASQGSTPRSGRFGGWIIGLVIFGGIFLFNFFDNTTSVSTLRAGDCIEDPGLVEVIENVESVSCNDPHEVEVFAVVELDEPDGSRFPGADTVYESGMDACLPRFSAYVGSSYEESVYWVDAWTPVEEGWDRGDREVLCVVYEVTEDFDIKSNTFSARNSGR